MSDQQPKVHNLKQIALVFAGFFILAMVYFFQQDLTLPISDYMSPNGEFIVNRTVRLVLNDLACLLIVYAIFRKQKYLKVGFLIFLLELLVILPVYLVFKLSMEGDSEISSPLLSQVHRLIVNPMLMILLMIAFLYQRIRQGHVL